MNKKPLGLDKATADAINQNMNKNPFAGIKQPDPPTEINESVQEIREAYSFELFDSAMSRDKGIRKSAEETLKTYSDFAKREWLHNQDALTKAWNDPEIDEIEMPLVTIPLIELESLLVTLQVAIKCGAGDVAKIFESVRSTAAGSTQWWYTQPLIKMCKTVRKRKPYGKATDIFYGLTEVAAVPPIRRIERSGDEMDIFRDDDAGTVQSFTAIVFSQFLSTNIKEIGRKKIRRSGYTKNA
jgi:hypothetical protein